MKKLVAYNSNTIFWVCLLVNAAVTILSLSIPYIEGKMVDTVTSQVWSDFLLFAGLNLAFHIAIQIAFYWADIWQGKSELYVWQNITRITEGNLTRYNPLTSDLSESRIMQELGQSYEIIKPFFNAYPIKLILYSIRALVIIVILFSISPLIAALVVFLIPVFILVSQRYAKRLSSVNAAVVEDMKDSRDYLADKSKLSPVERFLSSSQLRAFGQILQRFARDKEKAVKTTSVFENFLSYAFLNLMILLTAIISAYQAFQHQMTIGNFFAIQLYVSQFWTPVEYFLDMYKEYAGAKKIIASFVQFLTPETIQYTTQDIQKIYLENYVGLGREGELLHAPVTTCFEQGHLYQIKARNGGGKTGLVTALLGLHNRYKG